MLVNRCFPTEFLQRRDLLAPLQGEAVHVCRWPGTSEYEYVEKAAHGVATDGLFNILVVICRIKNTVPVHDEAHDASMTLPP